MKRLLCALTVALLLIFILPACSVQDEGEPTCSFIDDSGYTVNIYGEPSRVAVLFSSYAEMWGLAGGETEITVYESVERGFVPQGTLLVDNGAGKTINLELLVSYKPDFVIASLDVLKQVEAVNFLRNLNIPCALFKIESFYDYKSAMQRLCLVTGNQTAYEQNVTLVENEIAYQKARITQANAKKVLFLRAYSTGAKAKSTANNFVCEMLSELNAINIADGNSVLLEGLSEEVILTENPEIIFISTMGDEESAVNYVESYFSSTLSSLSAVKNERYYYLDKNLFQYKPNARWSLAYKTLVDILLDE